jgi:hypothetical protein
MKFYSVGILGKAASISSAVCGLNFSDIPEHATSCLKI